MPTAGRDGERAVSHSDGRLTVVHPLSGEQREETVGPLDRGLVLETIREVVAGLDIDA